MSDTSAMKNITVKLLAFTAPLMLSGLFQQLFNWVDAFIVGNTEGELALAGIGATTSLYNLFVTVITGLTSGLAVLTAQTCGKGKKESVRDILSTCSLLSGLFFLLISLIGMLNTNRILLLLGTPKQLFADASAYLQILFIGIPFLAVYNTYSAVLRGIGNSKAPFYAVLICSLINVILDLLFVVFLGYGTAGAAAATALSQAFMTIYLVAYTIRRYPYLHFLLSKSALRPSVLRESARFGLPPAIQSGVSSIGNVYLQGFMNTFGAQTVAAITTAYRVDTVIFLPIINLSSGIATIVAQKVGAGDLAKAKKVFYAGTLIMAAVSLALTGCVLLLGEHLISLFGLTDESITIGASFFHSIAPFYLIYGISMAIRGFLEGGGDMLFSGVTGVLALVARILCSYAFRPLFGNMVVAYAEAFSWFFLLAVFFLRYRRKRKKYSAKERPQEIPAAE